MAMFSLPGFGMDSKLWFFKIARSSAGKCNL